MDKNYFKRYNSRTHTIGRVSSVIVLVMLVGAPFLIGAYLGAMPDLGPTLRNTAVLDEWDARLAMQQPRDPQGIAAAALTAAEGGTKAVAEHGGNKH